MQSVYKAVLSSGRVVTLRDPKMKHMRLAEKITGGNTGMWFQEELLKQLILQIDETEIAKPDLMELDDMLSISEIMQLGTVVGKILGNETGNQVKLEQVFGER